MFSRQALSVRFLIHHPNSLVIFQCEIKWSKQLPECLGHLRLGLLVRLALPPVHPLLHVQQGRAGQHLPAELDGEALAHAVEEAGILGNLNVEVWRARGAHLRQAGVLWDVQQLDLLALGDVEEGGAGGGVAVLVQGHSLQLQVLRSKIEVIN